MATLIDVNAQFGTEEACLGYLEALRWPGGVACLKCGSQKVSKSKSDVKNRRTGEVSKVRYLYDCLEPECRHQFTATTGTIFHDTHLPLPKWFLAIALLCDAKKSVSAKQVQRHLGVQYRTAWHLCHRIRKAMGQEGGSPFVGTVEMDETFVGGKYDKRRKRARYDKTGVLGFVQRPLDGQVSQVRVGVYRKSNKRNLLVRVKANVSEEANLFTDTAPTYKALDDDYSRWTVNHSEREYARGEIHTNSIESFWSLFKRGIHGSFHSVSIKHLSRHLDEFAYRFNNRQHANLFGLTVAALVARIPLPHRELVSDPASS